MRNIDIDLSQAIFSDFDREFCENKLLEQFSAFCDSAQAEHLNIEDVDLSRIFDLYFEQRPPFGIGKKKAEFPDAVVLNILEKWADSESLEVLIASSDKDIKEGVTSFKKLRCVGRFGDLLEYLSNLFDELAPIAQKAYLALVGTIESQLVEQFSSRGVDVDDVEADVGDVKLIDISLNSSLLHVEVLDDDKAEATYDVIVLVKFQVDLVYGDVNSATYDHENGILIFHHYMNKTVDCSEVLQAKVVVTFAPCENYPASARANFTTILIYPFLLQYLMMNISKTSLI